MILKIIAEIVLAIATYVFARQFWACIKREKYLRQVLSNESQLENFITRDVLENPSPLVALFAQPNEVGYFINIRAISMADRASTRRIKGFSAIGLIAIAVASHLVDSTYIIFNTIALLLAWVGPLSQPAQTSALQHVLALALIFHKWHMKDPTECKQFFEQALALRPLYNVVKKLH